MCADILNIKKRNYFKMNSICSRGGRLTTEHISFWEAPGIVWRKK